jgi:hypothetical protein
VPVTGWRSPALAPVYALTTAFVVVLGIGLLAPKPTLMVRMNADGPDATVEIVEASGVPVETGKLPARGAYELPDMDGNRQVCVRLPEPWRVTQPANGCTTGQVGADVQVAAVRAGRVHVVFEGTPTESATVSLRDKTSVESVEVTETGYHQPRGSLAGQTICVKPPRNWIVRDSNMVERAGTWCTPAVVADPQNDVEVILADGSL